MTEASSKAKLSPRKQPRQDRARKTVAKILTATRQILAEQGAAALTTVNVAKVSGVNISSLYQYFPNKQSILFALYQDRLEAVKAILEQFEQDEYFEMGPEKYLHAFFDAMDGLQWYDKVDLELNKAIYYTPELEELSESHGTYMINRFCKILRRFGSEWEEGRLRCLAEYVYMLDDSASVLNASHNEKGRGYIQSWNRQLFIPLLMSSLNK